MKLSVIGKGAQWQYAYMVDNLSSSMFPPLLTFGVEMKGFDPPPPYGA
jgi:hypothetical protein